MRVYVNADKSILTHDAEGRQEINELRAKRGRSVPLQIILPMDLHNHEVVVAVSCACSAKDPFAVNRAVAVGNMAEIELDLWTQESVDVFAHASSVNCLMEVIVRRADGDDLRLFSVRLWVEDVIMDDDYCPQPIVVEWKHIYDQIKKIAADVKAITVGTVENVVHGESANVELVDGKLNFKLVEGPQGEKGVQGDVGPRGGSPYPGANGNWWNDLGDTGVPVHQDVDLSHLVPKTELQKTLEGYAKPAELTLDEYTLLPSKDVNGVYFIK